MDSVLVRVTGLVGFISLDQVVYQINPGLGYILLKTRTMFAPITPKL